MIELLAMVAVVVLLAGLMMPKMKGERKGRAQRIKCVNNLKNIALAFRIHSGDGETFPGPFLMSNGVEMASIDSVMVFGAISNEVADPRILVCPAEGEKCGGGGDELNTKEYQLFRESDCG